MAKEEDKVIHDFFCTVGSGLEKFCSKELTKLGSTVITEICVGKVFFSSSLPINVLLSLKTAERLFLLIHKEPEFFSTFPKRKSIYKFREIVENCHSREKWNVYLSKWRDFLNASGTKCSNFEEISFRVSCKCSGKIKNIFSPGFLGKIFAGSLLNVNKKWTTNLRDPQLEVLVHATMDYIVVGLPCCPTNSPLSKRSYLNTTKTNSTLRPTICFAMLDSAISDYERSAAEETCQDEKNAEINRHPLKLLDPMCGSGMILAEAVTSLNLEQGLLLYGSDLEASQLIEAVRNLNSAHCKRIESISHKVRDAPLCIGGCISEVFLGDSRAIPFKNNSIDIIVCDIPFGLKHKGKTWKRDLPNINNKGVEHIDECHSHQYKDVKSPVDESCTDNIPTNREMQMMKGSLDSSESRNIVHNREIESRLNPADMGDKVVLDNLEYSRKRRKTNHPGDKTVSDTVDEVRQMLPLVVTEMNRVLVSGGRAVLLISESLRPCLIEIVQKITHSTHSLQLSSDQELPQSSECERNWICREQHEVKLGVLDAVICVFIK